MAGNYPDVPGRQLMYDRDGSVGFLISTSNNVTQLSTAQLQAMNDEGTGSGPSAGPGRDTYVGLVFPEPRDLQGIFWSGQIVNNGSQRSALFEWSGNTTNGFDGTWQSLTTIAVNTTVKPNYRSGITSVAQAGVLGIRTRASVFTGAVDGWHYWTAVHFYGDIAAGETPDRLRLWHPTLDQELDGAAFDWGNVPRSSSADVSFRVKNNSAGLSANSVTVDLEALTDTTPSVAGQHLFSTDGTNFVSSVNLGTLAPGGLSGVVTMRRVTPSDAILSLWRARVVAVAGSWS